MKLPARRLFGKLFRSFMFLNIVVSYCWVTYDAFVVRSLMSKSMFVFYTICILAAVGSYILGLYPFKRNNRPEEDC